MLWKDLVLKLCSEMFLTNQNAGFCNLEYLLNQIRYQLDFLYVDRYPLLLQIDYGVIA